MYHWFTHLNFVWIQVKSDLANWFRWTRFDYHSLKAGSKLCCSNLFDVVSSKSLAFLIVLYRQAQKLGEEEKQMDNQNPDCWKSQIIYIFSYKEMQRAKTNDICDTVLWFHSLFMVMKEFWLKSKHLKKTDWLQIYILKDKNLVVTNVIVLWNIQTVTPPHTLLSRPIGNSHNENQAYTYLALI